MARAWRIVKRKYADHAFDGEGTRQYGSRWTSPGISVAFAAESLSLAVLEVLVHLQSTAPLADYAAFTVDYADRLAEDLGPAMLPANWRDFPAPSALQGLGDTWVRRGSSVLLRVPSAIIPHEHNIVINPAHHDFAQLRVTGPSALDVDPRVFQRAT
jgi:RES domain-containing protein